MLKTKVAVLLATGLIAGCVDAQNTETAIRKNIEPRLGGAKIDSIKETPYSGLYELRVGGDILYTDKKAEYLFIGQVFDAKSSKNLTRERIDQLNKVKFSDLPLNLALKQVKGDGKRVIAVFEDPNCGYCKRLRATTLAQLDNVTIYTFMYNILSPDSFEKSKNIWCSPNQVKAWDDWMINGKVPTAAPSSCETPNDKVVELGHKLNIQGTPAIFFTDGSRIPGAVDLKTLEAKLESLN
ncbi:DsbC family protein [Massilia sp. IC2-278]|uniref:DsbC family protein n=1 Tax=Massilia sp. IC2-278 TaxID=2887200 RepID=UPI001E293C23|nr:DsbC family protein [Massilia sp. IC2-278]MCC2961120.1 DsbC family protein [Massilia sp. IC2-278]